MAKTLPGSPPRSECDALSQSLWKSICRISTACNSPSSPCAITNTRVLLIAFYHLSSIDLYDAYEEAAAPVELQVWREVSSDVEAAVEIDVGTAFSCR